MAASSGNTFKTIYFPASRVKSGRPTRVTISIPPAASELPQSFLSEVRDLSSHELRVAIGDRFLEDLESTAAASGRSLSSTCLRQMWQRYEQAGSFELSTNGDGEPRDTKVTFRESKRLPLHGWYPYVEGFSATYVRDAILRFEPRPDRIYDPFGGAGTTQVVASTLGIKSYYSEINPFMVFVAETKTSSAKWCKGHWREFEKIADKFLSLLRGGEINKRARSISLAAYKKTFPGRDFFVEKHLRHLLAAKELATELANGVPQIESVLHLACAANVVNSSNMTRRADLRRRRSDEYKTRVVDVGAFIATSLERMLEDISLLPRSLARTSFASSDCRSLSRRFDESFDLAITSPPYLNGTNYFRNTKLELWFMGFISSEGDLRTFRDSAICAGINNVSKSRVNTEFSEVEQIARQLDECAADRRIPSLVRGYFSDMAAALGSIYRSLKPGGRFILDIGDSKFYGVHVPTDSLLLSVARRTGFDVESVATLARRTSFDKSELTQKELVLRKPSK